MSNEIIIKQPTAKDYVSFVETMFLAAGRTIDSNFLEERKESFNPDRSFAAFHNEKIVGTIATRPLTMTLSGGKSIPVAAIGQGGVLPSFTRKGIMRKLMTSSMQMAADLKEPAIVWTTSEWPLYGRFGGGVSSFIAEYEISRSRVKILDEQLPISGTVKLINMTVVSKIFPELHAKHALNSIGGVPRDAAYWNVIFTRLKSGYSLDVLDTGVSFPPPIACVYENNDGIIEGCSVFRILNKWEQGLPDNQLQVIFFVALNSSARISMWHFLFNFDLIETICLYHRPVHEPLRWLINDGRRLITKAIYDHVWCRVLDPIECITKRQFPAMQSPLTISINDKMKFIKPNTIEIFSDGSVTSAAYINTSPQVTLEVDVFSSIFMGGVPIWNYIDTGKVQYLSFADLVLLSSLFQSFEPPFTDTSF